ncbi:pyridoxine/pyridoxamine 5'-phosphate oxidase [Saonia flava]|uniref:Pyridoxine/pyridoxamine 5'-phosphate oxidase n=1 Tax=Saonia flava TaxID=523696 RepID=A0A846R0Y9_9FLAO|nr:pyridoxamine 5'-phosphate oxidase family protein [Saonia flava]NJB70529.1 pyridoxine/pyridoxamine 5'-phosphate oxidase [Saonia flava]
MATPFFTELKEELKAGVSVKGHPFRFFTLGTVGLERMARLRTVVLRELTPELQLIFYTDRRSKKILHIKENNRVSLLFYHPEKLLQLKIEGIASIFTSDDKKKKVWQNLNAKSKKAYTSSMAPGSSITNFNEIEYLKKEDFFCWVEVEPFKIEYLKLSEPHHTRIRFSRMDTDWESEFLVP